MAKSETLPEVVFYVYNIFDQEVCQRFTFEMKIPKNEYIRNPENNQLVVDPMNRKTIEFVNGFYRTNNPKEIAALDAYNEDCRKANVAPAVLITREVLYPIGTKVQKINSGEVKEVKYMPANGLARLDLQSIIELALEEFNFTITSPTAEEAIEELKNAGHAK